MEIRRDPIFRWPTMMKRDPRRCDCTKFYEYHGENGHLKEECVALYHKIESFIRNERLLRFLAEERNQGRNPQALLLDGNQDALGGLEPRC
jgi:hypothetical protein